MRVEPADVVFVSSTGGDGMGAASFGFRAAWINRSNLPDEYADGPPAVVLKDLPALLTIDRGPCPRAPALPSRQLRKDARPAPRALVERREIVLLVGRVHPVVIEREADEQRIHAEHVAELADDRNRAARADGHRLLAPFGRERGPRPG